ncbi:hypothetical protein P0W64_07925 [Tsukamurella sp. 8F]|uniref:hypothetical protein n=1 Tax=unclassified Tsukamurella TaxID=2633480 RepID=UPI0023B90E58|nr:MULTISPECIES: hypothetical protein [unclassified Tsukamurella]MDF0528861.1 hypothetical protein [Tsukamurella sp. 8J]MDF0586696.1 hypothetical protein [Tsukamurella sp. 8F]
MTFVWILIMLGVLAMLFVTWQRSRSGGGRTMASKPGLEQGTLTLTGVTDRPLDGDRNGDAFVTVTGTVTGPSTAPTPVYLTYAMKLGASWPEVGDEVPVVYKVGKVESSWKFGTLAPPM